MSRELERVEANAHELAELRALNRLRRDSQLQLSAEERTRLWRALGGAGLSLPSRLGFVPRTEDEIVAVRQEWRGLAANVLSSPDMQRFARLAARSLSDVSMQIVAQQ